MKKTTHTHIDGKGNIITDTHEVRTGAEQGHYRIDALLSPGGPLTVAHGMSREKIDVHHHDNARDVSCGLMAAEELSKLLGKYSTYYVRLFYVTVFS